MTTKLPHSLRDTLPGSYPVDWEALEMAHHLQPVNSIRINPRKYTRQFDNEENVKWCKYGKYLHKRPSFTYDPLFHAGTYYVQEASSMFLEHALEQVADLKKDLTVLDLCAAPGGKSTHIASLITEKSLLISNEIIGTRVNILAENITKWGYDNTWVSHNDPVHFSRIPGFFDVMLVDAPCSGSGLFRKMPDYCNSWNTDLVNLCVQRQQRILHDVYSALAQNGLMVYMTCSFCKSENEEILDFLLSEFDMESCRVSLNPDMGVIETQSEIHKAFGYRFFPHLLRGEGFFLAVLRKRDGEEKRIFENKTAKQSKTYDTSRFIASANYFTFLQNENLIAIQQVHKEMYQYLSEKIKLVRKGVLLGKQLPNEIIPSHELALYEKCVFDENTVSLDLKNAVSYLKKENIEVQLSKKGWYLVIYEGFALGWLKNIGNRINNYYPSNYRILSQNILPS